MSIQAVGWVLDHSAARGTDLLVLIAIANVANGRRAEASVAEIAHVARTSPATVHRHLVHLESIGELEVETRRAEHGEQMNSVYSLPKITESQIESQTESQVESLTDSQIESQSSPGKTPGTTGPQTRRLRVRQTRTGERHKETHSTSSSVENPPLTPPKANRGTRVPESFTVTAELRAWAREEAPGVNLAKATREFIDYWRGVPGQKGTKLDWVATWRNRMRTIAERQGTSNRPPRPREETPSWLR